MNVHRKNFLLCFLFAIGYAVFSSAPYVHAETSEMGSTSMVSPSIFDDKFNLEGYTNEYSDYAQKTLIEMIKDDTLNHFKMAAAVRVFRRSYATEIFFKEKSLVEKTLLRRLNRTESPFVQVEIMHTLCLMDRYRYFKPMMPMIILKLDHYNETVNEIAYNAIEDIIATGSNRSREARVVFNTLRKVLFLKRKKLAVIEEPDERLQQKLTIIRWAVKILGTRELERLPKEVIHLF